MLALCGFGFENGFSVRVVGCVNVELVSYVQLWSFANINVWFLVCSTASNRGEYRTKVGVQPRVCERGR